MARIVANIKAFARQGDFERRPMLATAPLEAAIELLDSQLRQHGVSLARRYDPEHTDLALCADANTLQQIFINLLSNARDALDEASKAQLGRRKVVRVGIRCSTRSKIRATASAMR